ncbi:MAG: hypothetical protein SFU86_23760 [Pirellulaceae bacterium]|nr:hypothetical protein [Pirellulaceae bacterium]
MDEDIVPAMLVEPVTAEVVAPPPSPWRFGLKALLGLMAVCSVQFAVMNYFGVLWGLCLGMLACIGVFAVILLVGMALSGNGTRWLARLDVFVVRLMVAIIVLFFGSIFAGGGTAAYHAVARIRTESLVERQLGLSFGRQPFVHKSEFVSCLKITSVTSGSAADQAGLKVGEVLVISGTIDEFLDLMHDNFGKDMDINVATPNGSQALENCPQRSVTLSIPK